MHFINLSGYLAASVQIKPVVTSCKPIQWLLSGPVCCKFLLRGLNAYSQYKLDMLLVQS